MTSIDALAAALARVGDRQIVILTGAGISAASGLPTFRGTDSGAIWARDVTEIATRAFFHRDPVTWWRWFLERFGGILEARPNAAHAAVADLERWHVCRGGAFLLVTQNVDTLHEAAGSARIAKVHGTADRMRCSRDGCRLGAPRGSLPVGDVDLAAFIAAPSPERLPRCPACGDPIRAHALLFDEYYTEHADYRFDAAEKALGAAAVIVFVGTSFSVGITELALWRGRESGAAMFAVDPVSPPPRGVAAIAEEAEAVLPRLVGRLAAS